MKKEFENYIHIRMFPFEKTDGTSKTITADFFYYFHYIKLSLSNKEKANVKINKIIVFRWEFN